MPLGPWGCASRVVPFNLVCGEVSMDMQPLLRWAVGMAVQLTTIAVCVIIAALSGDPAV